MKSITWIEIENIAEPGDALIGDFECINYLWDNETKDYQKVIEKKNKLEFCDFIDNKEMPEGSKLFEHNDELYNIAVITDKQLEIAHELSMLINKHCEENATSTLINKLNELVHAFILEE